MNELDMNMTDSILNPETKSARRKMRLITKISFIGTLIMVALVPVASVISQIFMKITGENIRTENMLYIENPIVLPFMQITAFLTPIVVGLWLGVAIYLLKNKIALWICSGLAIAFMIISAYPFFLLGALLSGLPEMWIASLFNAPPPMK